MNDKILLLVGASGIGKTSIANYLEMKYKLRTLKSYTTRPKRYDKEEGHIFVSEDIFLSMMGDMCAYTQINGFHYGAIAAQVEVSDIYVIDEIGIKTFLKNYEGKKDFIIMRLFTDDDICRNRMLKRGDDIEDVNYRMIYDKKREKMFDDIVNGIPDEKIIKFNIGNRSVEEIGDHIYRFIF